MREIHTAWDHPQAKGPLAIVGIAVGIGRTEQSPATQFVHIDEADALLISAAPDLLDALDRLLMNGDVRDAADAGALKQARAARDKALGMTPNARANLTDTAR